MVAGTENVGGLVGFNLNHTIENCYATGTVTATSVAGGLCGYNFGIITNSYYDTQTTGMGNTGCGYNSGTITNLAGLTTEEFKTNVFTGFAFGNNDDNPWTANENGRPFLYRQSAAVSNGTAANNTIAGYAAQNGATITETGIRYTLLSEMNWGQQAVANSAGAILHTLTGLLVDSVYIAHAYTKDDAGKYYFGDMVNFIAELALTPLPIVFHPEENATEVPLANIVAVEFDIPITQGDLSGITITPDPGNVTAILSGQKITLIHDDFEYSTTYTVTVPAGAVIHGEATNEEISWSFITIIPIGIDGPGGSQVSISVWPNPSNNIFNIQIKNPTEKSNWEVSDTHGAIIKKGNNQINDFTIDLSSYPQGTYYLKITNGGFQTVRKLVLQH
ncbi:MAG: hypothetical protein B6I19_09710 [Bacteroidetes bacterium 4572_114]|nr:MAG: hypothetical protein B6I19_09710 [Bacteroidetes bacterium 4572_114]